MIYFNIYAPDIHEGDAVGNHCLGMARLARRLGFAVRIYSQRQSLTTLNEKIYSIDMAVDHVKDEDIFFLSYSIYDSKLEDVLNLPCRLICYFHDVTPPDLLHDHDPITAELCQKSIAQFSRLASCNKIIANSQQSLITLKKHVENEIFIMPPVFRDLALFNYSRHLTVETKQYKDLLCVGRVVPHKKIEDVLLCFSKARTVSNENLRLSIVGTMPNFEYNKYLVNYAQELGILEYVSFCGKLSEYDLYLRYLESDLLISMSGHEGFCIPVLEAMYFGMPVVLREGTAADEVVGKSCCVVKNINEASEEIVDILSTNKGDITKIKVIKRANELLDQTNDDKWQSIVTSLKF